jgi:hypothetical protein
MKLNSQFVYISKTKKKKAGNPIEPKPEELEVELSE